MTFTKSQLDVFNNHWDSKKEYHDEVKRLLAINNGCLVPFLRDEMKKMFTRPDGKLSPTYAQAVDRLVPVNILQRMVKKQSKIYARPPKREAVDGSDNEKAILDFYTRKMNCNRQLTIANQMFSLFDCAAVEPGLGRYAVS